MTGPVVMIVLAKAPVPGQVKTRLCPPATPAEAADIAAAALLDTLDAVRGVPGGRLVVPMAGRLDRAARGCELEAALRGVPTPAQRGADLGERIAAAHIDAACGLPTFQIGMDTPQVEPALLAESAAHLLRPGGVDAVLGPATDGGWWALGLRDPRAAALVASVPTSRADTGERTVQALRSAGLRVGSLPELTDVDTAADALRVRAAAPRTRFAAAVDRVAQLVAAGC
ncbi:TIGR04282 family arsenosugar biosynthesis glycosyltransferase [Pseudonocardia sp. TRM90224]|uniref:TIGR04282 family arsenosugar biosynthesis glycosyltransferase n=1 Tax=Pseudonocardia sp. TRM90224 TaxID=2812678 RepID=UPI001E394EDF|nr:DUF2064 domain-containing protein [Pseudonocardia sp. TRM90224]